MFEKLKRGSIDCCADRSYCAHRILDHTAVRPREIYAREYSYRCKSYIPHPSCERIEVKEIKESGYLFKAKYQFPEGQIISVFMMEDPRGKAMKRVRLTNPHARTLEGGTEEGKELLKRSKICLASPSTPKKDKSP